MRVHQVSWICLAFGLLGACHGSPPDAVAGSYGSLSYSGIVTRSASGADYIYTVKDMTFVFDGNSRVNHTDAIRKPVLQLITTVTQPDTSRVRLTSQSSSPLAFNLDASHPTAALHEVKFSVSKKLVDSSTHTVLNVTDGHLLWPMPTELKHRTPRNLTL